MRTYKGYRYQINFNSYTGVYTWSIFRPAKNEPMNYRGNSPMNYRGETLTEEYAIEKAETCIDKLTA